MESARPGRTTALELSNLGPVVRRYPAAKNPAHHFLAQKNPASWATYRGALEILARELSGGEATAETFNWPALGYEHTNLIAGALARRYKPQTANKYFCVLRGVLLECFRLGYIDADAYHRAVMFRNVKDQTLPSGRELEPAELRALLQACPRTILGARDAAIIALLYVGGLRRAELVALDLDDYEPEQSRVVVNGKGNKERVVGTNGAADRYLEVWTDARGHGSGPLFCSVRHGAPELGARLNPQTIRGVIVRVRKAAGVGAFTPHDLRRTLITGLLRQGIDLALVSALVGHANPATTKRYDKRTEHEVRQAARRVHLPVVGVGKEGIEDEAT